MEISGKTVAVLELVSGTSKAGNSFQKREFVIETAGKYPKKVCLQLFGDKVNDCPNVGEEVKVSFDIDSREFNGRWYTQLNAWKVEHVGTTVSQTIQQPQYVAPEPVPAQPFQNYGNLPF